MLYCTADTHFGHTNIIKYCDRPYKTIEEMNESYISVWNSVVTNEDWVYHIGDFGFLSKQKTLEIINRLNGMIYLVPGNHDKKIKNLYIEDKFLVLGKIGEEVTTQLEDYIFVMSHFPLDDWQYKEHKAIHLHGHSHGTSPKLENRYDVGIDVYKKPVPLNMFIPQNKELV
jgi:calcineurin-like phosphoesterase family protein